MFNLDLLKQLIKPNLGWLVVLSALGLMLVGMLAIDTATRSAETDLMSNFAKKQLVFIPISICAMLITAIPHHRYISHLAFPLSIVILILLILLLIPGLLPSIFPMKNGAKRWIDLQFAQFQPSELAKLIFVIALASYLKNRSNYRTFKGLFVPLVITFIPMGLILKEPDLGTAMIFLPVLFAMLIAAGAKLKHLLLIILLGLVLMPSMYPLLKPHQKARIRAIVGQWTGDVSHRQNIGYQGYKATTLVGAGQVTGYGDDRANTILRFNRLPESHNDMIFAPIVNRWGMLGGVALIALYMLFFASSLIVASMNKDPFARLVVVGIVAVLFTQMFVNIGMTIGILPITGMTLPLVSYGGTSLVANGLMVGMILNVAARRPLIMGRPYFEYTSYA